MFELSNPTAKTKKKPTGTATLTKEEFLKQCSATDRLYWLNHPEQFKTFKFKQKVERVKEEPKQIKRIAHVTIQPDNMHIYTLPEGGHKSSAAHLANQKNLRNNSPKNGLSDDAAKRIKNAIKWLLVKSTPKKIWNSHQQEMMFFRLNFITVTLPSTQQHSDQEITSRCLGNFLDLLRANGLKDYVWRAECQPGTSNIHYHITTNTFFYYKDVRRWWNSSVNLLGYVDRFQAKHGHCNPNSTDISKVKHIRKLAEYLSCYLAKEKPFQPIGEVRMINRKRVEVLYTSKVYRDEKAYKKTGEVIAIMLSERVRIIESKLWGCSQTISKCKGLRFNENSIQWQAVRELSLHHNLKRIPGDFVDSYYGDIVALAKQVSAGLYEDIIDHANGEKVSDQVTDNKVLQYL